MKQSKMLGTFKATNKSPNAYKSDNTYISALYRKNKAYLSEHGLTKEKFTSRMKNIIEEGYTRREAAYRYSRTRLFLSKEQVGLQNIKEHLTKSEALEVRKASGHYRKGIDWNEYRWSNEKQGYVHVSGNHMIQWGYGSNSEEDDYIVIEYL